MSVSPCDCAPCASQPTLLSTASRSSFRVRQGVASSSSAEPHQRQRQRPSAVTQASAGARVQAVRSCAVHLARPCTCSRPACMCQLTLAAQDAGNADGPRAPDRDELFRCASLEPAPPIVILSFGPANAELIITVAWASPCRRQAAGQERAGLHGRRGGARQAGLLTACMECHAVALQHLSLLLDLLGDALAYAAARAAEGGW